MGRRDENSPTVRCFAAWPLQPGMEIQKHIGMKGVINYNDIKNIGKEHVKQLACMRIN